MNALKMAFPNSSFKSNVILCTRNKKGEWKEAIAKIPSNNAVEYLEELKINKNLDYYITSNTIKNKKRAKRENENQFSFRNIVIDIDIHKNLNEWETEQELNALYVELLLNKALPKPNIINYTGRGLQVWYCLEEININFKMQWLAVVSELIARIEKMIIRNPDLYNCEVDKKASKNVIGVFRLFNTYNTKTNTQGQAELIHSNRFKLQELYAFLGIEPKKKKQEKTLQEIETDFLPLYKKRKKFIEWLAEQRKNNIKGCRDLLIFQYANACYGFLNKEQAREETENFNNTFLEPLPSTEVQKIFNYLNTHGVLDRITVNGFFEFLNCSQAEAKHYNAMRTVKTNYTRDNERKFRNMNKDELKKEIIKLRKNGVMIKEIVAKTGTPERTVKRILTDNNISSKDLKEARNEKIFELKNKGLTVAEITKLTGISRETYYRILRQCKEVETI